MKGKKRYFYKIKIYIGIKRILFQISLLAALFLGQSVNHLLSAQSSSNDDLLKKGKEYVYKNDYKNAEITFRKALLSKEVVKDEICYFYGLSLIKLGKIDQGVEYLDKYQNLTHKQGEYVKNCIEIKKELGEKICKRCKGTGTYFTYDSCTVCEKGKIYQSCLACKGKGKVICTHCKGEKVLKINDGFKVWYKDCNACKAQGWISCVRCKGTLKETIKCTHCNGNGKIPISHQCIPHVK